MSNNILSVDSLKTHFFQERGVVKAVDGVSLQIEKGSVLGLVGESGCGKTVTAMSIMRLIQQPGRIISGKVMFGGKDLVSMGDDELRRVRGGQISMVFQDPGAALNPSFTVGQQIEETFIIHQKANKKEAKEKAVEIMELVGIPSARDRLKSYPHQLSGGMQQRVMIAIALSCHPSLLIADEPTTNLDVTIQAQILNLMKQMGKEFNSAILLITHDLGVVAQMCDKVAVMYAGKIVELADSDELFYNPLHPYTIALLQCIPRRQKGAAKLKVIKGQVPDLMNPPSGCNFHPRCPKVMSVCSKAEPALMEVKPGHFVACYLYGESSNE